MKQGKSLFLTGDSGEGKTTLLFQCLKPYHTVTGGFFSQRLVNESGDTVGFRLASAKEVWEPKVCYEDGLTNIFLKRTIEGMVSYPEVFQKEGRKFLTSHGDHKLILMDEIGGVELLIPEFMEAVYACVKVQSPVLVSLRAGIILQ